MATPNISSLTLISYTNVEGSKAIVQIIPELNSVWYDLGLLLGQSTAELDSYKQLALMDGSKYPCCRRVFSKWLESKEGRYPVTWAGVYELLRDMERAGLATKLQEALSRNEVKL